MKAHFAGFMLALGSAATLGIGYGCAFNPFAPPDFDERPGAGKNDAISSSSSGGAGGQGGLSGAGGMGGTPCKCPDDANECTVVSELECPNGDPTACSQKITFGAQCSSGGCNEMGECVSCLMCDSPECMARCEKMACSEDGQCAKGFCEQNTCCNEECVGPCRACDRTGIEGTCTRMPKGLAVCEPGSLCDNNGECVADAKMPLGALCTSSNNCASGLCRREYCQSQIDEPCVEDIECTTNLCDPSTRTCKSCAGVNAPTCPTGTSCNIQFGRCTVLPGQPAGSTEECASGTRTPHRCVLAIGAECTSHAQCIYGNCLGTGKCSAPCTKADECAAGTACDVPSGLCKLPVGSYCINDFECQWTCGGFPRRCRPVMP